jgi:hypothetical protein
VSELQTIANGKNYEDNILAELTVYHRGTYGLKTSWEAIAETPLWNSLPDSIRTEISAQNRIHTLQTSRCSVEVPGYWKDLVAKYEAKKMAEEAAKKVDFFKPKK